MVVLLPGVVNARPFTVRGGPVHLSLSRAVRLRPEWQYPHCQYRRQCGDDSADCLVSRTVLALARACIGLPPVFIPVRTPNLLQEAGFAQIARYELCTSSYCILLSS